MLLHVVKSVSLAAPPASEETLVDKFVSLYASALAHPVVKVVLLAGFTGECSVVYSA